MKAHWTLHGVYSELQSVADCRLQTEEYRGLQSRGNCKQYVLDSRIKRTAECLGLQSTGNCRMQRPADW